jgi:hypothetical protein
MTTLLCGGAVLACLCIGCGAKPTGLENLVPVKGKVVFSGKPVPGGNTRSLVLTADRSKGNTTEHEPRAEIDKDGNFEVFTANRKGAPPGQFKVAVILKEEPIRTSKNMYEPGKWLIDEKYGSPETSGLTLNVVENPEGPYELRITN